MHPQKQLDPAVLAEIRWFVNKIENAAIEAYSGNRESYDDLRQCLLSGLNCIGAVKQKYRPLRDECPWPLQPDGECRPC